MKHLYFSGLIILTMTSYDISGAILDYLNIHGKRFAKISMPSEPLWNAEKWISLINELISLDLNF